MEEERDLVAGTEPGKPRPNGGAARPLRHVGPTDALAPDLELTGTAAYEPRPQGTVGISSAGPLRVPLRIALQLILRAAMRLGRQVK
jgi:hypothetical protein